MATFLASYIAFEIVCARACVSVSEEGKSTRISFLTRKNNNKRTTGKVNPNIFVFVSIQRNKRLTLGMDMEEIIETMRRGCVGGERERRGRGRRG